MKMALALARRGLGRVEPNPAVGAVIVRGADVIGRGWHKKFGAPHAEVNAIADCLSAGRDAAGATMYVTLEPCCHVGKTGPCAEAIIAANIARVVVATIDPSEHNNGRGVERLRNAKVSVEVGLCERPARLLNAPFLKFARTRKCWVTLKWAQSIDCKLALADTSAEPPPSGVLRRVGADERRWLSGPASRKDAHKLRRRAGAIAVGIETVLADGPLLTPRPAGGKKPLRIVLDRRLRIPLQCRLLATASDFPVMVLTGQETYEQNRQKAGEIEATGAEVIACPADTGSNLPFLLDLLSSRQINHLLVEGGAKLITSFLRDRLADELVVYVAPKILGAEGTVGICEGLREMDEALELACVETKRLGDDVRVSGLTLEGLRALAISET